MIDVTALGEILIDFTPVGMSEQGNPMYAANPGGAPGNVMVSLSCLGKNTAFIGSVGKDQFGELLVSTLQSKGVHVNGIVYSDINTTLAFVHIDEDGERSFSFYRKPGADMMLSKEDLNLDLVKESKIFHVGSISMTNEPVREATLTALQYAKKHQKAISFDPNLRPLLWESLEKAKKQILTIMTYADIVKISDEELEFLTGVKDISVGAKQIYQQFQTPLLLVTLGSKGSYGFFKGKSLFVPAISVQPVDTTGCGDAFFAGVLYQIIENDLLHLNITEIEMEKILRFGNGMGAYVAGLKGAIPSMPTKIQIDEFLKNR